jgi:tRNA G18 (ribose-2'-O)-methylase SpoU
MNGLAMTSRMIVIAHNIRSLHNVGAIFRNADAFHVEKLYLTGYTPAPPRKEIAKTALGSETRVAWEKEEDVLGLIRRLQKEEKKVLALEIGENALSVSAARDRFDPAEITLVLGNEVAGLEPEVLAACDATVMIPMLGQKRSLNVSVASGIALFALCGKKE